MRGAVFSRPQAMIQSLERRVFLAFNPTPQEQELLELVNRMRMNPADELDLLLNAHNTDIDSALDQFQVNLPNLRSQWAQLKPVPPVAWNAALSRAARAHSQKMIDADIQSHQVPGEPSLRDRVDAQGYDPQSYLGENVYAYATSPLHAHAAFAIDWGPSPSGIQRPPGHRNNMMDVDPAIPIGHREVGISVLRAPSGKRQTGPLVITQEFGAPLNPGKSYLLGTIRAELNNNGRYNAGEGLGGVTVRISNGSNTYTTTTMSAGAYQLRLPPGTYTITASGGGLASPVIRKGIVLGGDNVKVDVLAPPDPVVPRARLTAGKVTTAGGKAYTFTVTYTDNALVRAASIGKGDVVVSSAQGQRQTARFISKTPTGNAASIRATYQITPPGGTWDRRDNGKYTIAMVANQVKDLARNAVAARTLGTFLVGISDPTSARPKAPAPDSQSASAPGGLSAMSTLPPTRVSEEPTLLRRLTGTWHLPAERSLF